MKSVDALRKWADGLRGIWIDPNDHSIIVTTCDDMPPSIDCVSLREHVNAILDEIEREVADMVPLPVDADGEPIHVGDAMEADDGTTFEVEHISLYPWGWRCIGEGTDRSGFTCTAHAIPDGCRHHHAPTVEDVLREFAQEMNENLGMYTGEAIDADEWRDADADTIAEYAAKLRLAGEE